MKGLLHSLLILAPVLSFAQSKASIDSMSLYFEFNSYEISFRHPHNSETKTKLSTLKNQPLILRAYTDSTGSKEYNIKLAEARLDAVKKFLNKTYPNQFTIRTEVAVGEDISKRSDADKRRVDILVNTSKTSNHELAAKKKRTFELNVPIQLKIQFIM